MGDGTAEKLCPADEVAGSTVTKAAEYTTYPPTQKVSITTPASASSARKVPVLQGR